MSRRLVMAVTVAAVVGAGSLTGPALARPIAPAPSTVLRSALFTVPATALADPVALPVAPVSSPPVRLQAGCASHLLPSPAGEGIVSVTMAAPGTSWASPINTSVVVDLRVDGGPVQQVVLFGGSVPYRYEGFVGPLTGGTHCVAVTVRPDLSRVVTVRPVAKVYSLSLGIVPPGSPSYLLETHDPVLYGRSTSGNDDTPLITYGEAAPDPDGIDRDLSYTVIWTHEDVGDGVVPAYEWGLWGRMTDIETVLHEKVAPSGRILSASYLSCGCESLPVYPDILPENPGAGGETDKAYPATGTSPGFDWHLGIRDATGNNDISPTGTTPFRFQQTLVDGPPPGASREVAMDRNPWTYLLSGYEIGRQTVQSTSPDDILAGVYPQYLIVDINSNPSNTGSVSVAVQLDGHAWYSNDYRQMTAPLPASTFPFYNGGHNRTVIKLPTRWHRSKVTGLQLVLNAANSMAKPALGPGTAIQLIELTSRYTIVDRPVPPVQVIDRLQLVPSALGH